MNGTGDSTKRINTVSLIESIVIMLISVLLYGVTFTFEEVPEILSQGVPPTVFPRAVLILMFGLAFFQAVGSLRLSMEEVSKLKPYKRIPPIAYFTMLLLIGYFLVKPHLGTFPTLAVFCPMLAVMWGERRWLLMLVSFTGFIAFIYVLFVMILNIPIP